MEVLAENRFTITKSLFFEGMLRVSKENYGKSARKAVAVLGLLWLVLAAAALWQRQGLVFVGVELLVVCLAGLWITVLLPRSKAKRAFEMLENRSGDLERVTRFYQDGLEVETSGTKKAVPYSEIVQVLHTKRLLILLSADRVGVLVKHDAFLSGSETIVRELIDQAQADTQAG